MFRACKHLGLSIRREFTMSKRRGAHSKVFLVCFLLFSVPKADAGGGGVEHYNCETKISSKLSALVVVYGNPFFQEIGNGVEVLPDPSPDPTKEYYYSVTDIRSGDVETEIHLSNSKEKPLGENLVLVFNKTEPKDELVVTLPDIGTKKVPMKCEYVP